MPQIPRPNVQLPPGVQAALEGGAAGLLEIDDLQELLETGDERRRLRENCDRIVVLMLENRSFDHLFGWLGPQSGGLTGNETNPGPSPQVAPGESSASRQVFETNTTDLAYDPPHGLFRAVRDEVNGGAMDGFVTEFARKKEAVKDKRGHHEWRSADIAEPMAFYGRDTLPAYRFLAERNTLCARYFSSVQSGTWVNRMLFYAGTSGGLADNPPHTIRRGDLYDQHMPRVLLANLLEDNGVDWAVYADGVPWMRLFRDNVLPPDRVHGFGSFDNDCRDNKLPEVVFVDPNPAEGPDLTANDDHVPVDLMHGQKLVQKVYNAVLSIPDGEKTVLAITYDEHGGFYDHVPPPLTPGWEPAPYFASASPLDTDEDPCRNDPFRFLGVRVPLIVVSRYAPATVVTADDVVMDHVSLHASIHRRFIPTVPMLSSRVAKAQTLGKLLTLENARPALVEMPEIDTPRSRRRSAAPSRLREPDDPCVTSPYAPRSPGWRPPRAADRRPDRRQR